MEPLVLFAIVVIAFGVIIAAAISSSRAKPGTRRASEGDYGGDAGTATYVDSSSASVGHHGHTGADYSGHGHFGGGHDGGGHDSGGGHGGGSDGGGDSGGGDSGGGDGGGGD